ncbi:MAG: Flp pilus assembly complex ATPase component TadA [Thermoleophilaceae bacterium]|nr:Flp pilus assembly complex ATPase component TadA [Thermoleophilaceae bacterium]
MSERQGGPTALRAVPEQGAEGTPGEAGANGLTPPQRRGASRFISDVIAELGFLPRERVEAAVEEGKATGHAPEQVLVASGAITGDQLARAVAQRFGLHHVDLAVFNTDVAALNLIGASAARRLAAVPIGYDDAGHLIVAMADPSNVLALDDLKLMTGHEVQPVVASPDDISGLIGRMSRLDDAVAAAVEQGEEEIADITEIRESADDAPVIKLVNSIIAQAVEDGASDIHFEPEERDMRVRFRVDGVLRESTSIPRRMVAGTVSRVKIMADLDIAERRMPQDGRVSLAVEGHAIDLRIVTIEDPVEYQLEGVNQIQVSTRTGLTFAAGLRAILRHDPDVVMIGEIRDRETAEAAIQASLTGHLVLSTLHTNDAPSAITRLTEMGIEPFLTASAVCTIVAQRLVRQLCTYCKRRTMLSVSSLEKAGFSVAFDLEAYEPVGCSRCGGSGYKGRTGLYEVMTISDEIRDLTVERASADDIRKVAVSQGMRPLRADGFEKVKNGVTSIAEVARVT